MDARNNEFQSVLVSRQQTEAIQELVNCALACDACSSACLSELDLTGNNRVVALANDCSEICFLVARLIMRKSEMTEQGLTMAEEICRLCADECKKHHIDSCDICAEACEECANICNHYYHVELNKGERD